MSLKLAKPTSAALRFAQGYTRPDDPDAVAYIAAVETADGQALETATRMAINAFVKGCKADGTWPALKASCILAGARTLNGALVPLVGPAPTNFNFVSGDYNRKTGLKGDALSKRLNSGYSGANIDTNNCHLVIAGTDFETAGAGISAIGAYAGGSFNLLDIILSNPNREFRCSTNVAAWPSTSTKPSSGVVIGSRISSTDARLYQDGILSATSTVTATASNLGSLNPTVFGLTNAGPTYSANTASRLYFYSIGLGLTASQALSLSTRVTALAAAIP